MIGNESTNQHTALPGNICFISFSSSSSCVAVTSLAFFSLLSSSSSSPDENKCESTDSVSGHRGKTVFSMSCIPIRKMPVYNQKVKLN